MNVTHIRAGPKRKRRLLQRRSQGLWLLSEYRFLSALQSPFGAPFWALEQRRARLADKLANMGIEL
jgi:hypothetical protein